MNLRRRMLAAQKYGAWTRTSRRRSTRRARKAENRIVARELDEGLDEELGDRLRDGPYPGERLAWDDALPGFASITIGETAPDGSTRCDGVDEEAFLSRRAWDPDRSELDLT